MDCCDHANEPSGSIKCGEFFGLTEELLASQEGPFFYMDF